MVSTDTQVTVAFVVLAVVLWYATGQTSDSDVLAWTVLIGVGVLLPLGVNGWRARSA
ncbi:hypothetical protein [Halalkalicoccus jeotgali]|uniref:Uncharacterized protein n=1 Tax=Halalkalicoccus jeotgali (strain DSM 18796 / CECT 7217 / JCM 14584 / KCTC 4019 / B3) TaxID=795797 RepID=D8J6S9_HALJB|nr:hypothetical protein [Halalkalicoccus jeotgali]ADJ15882.1 hypothetical protein HacjB3_12505 [Halalkalicoccus jeotgali B3]ELY37979.1 hypothetical protein C497_07704 [Halalkalicoccus jeotgali B3]